MVRCGQVEFPPCLIFASIVAHNRAGSIPAVEAVPSHEVRGTVAREGLESAGTSHGLCEQGYGPAVAAADHISRSLITNIDLW